jgi:hypothetical protein
LLSNATCAATNRCRKDREWGPDAVYTMVEIYLSPENEQLWDEVGWLTVCLQCTRYTIVLLYKLNPVVTHSA